MKMNNFQQEFQERIFTGAVDDEFLSQFSGDDITKLQKRFDVYRQGYLIRMHEYLLMDYKGTAALLGEDAFIELAHGYADSYPPVHYNAYQASMQFFEYMSSHPEYKDNRALLDMVLYEYALMRSSYSSNGVVLTTQAFGEVAAEDWPFIQLEVSSSVQFINMDYDPREFYKKLNNKETVGYEDLKPLASRWVISRNESDLFYLPINELKFKFLQACVEGLSFSEIAEMMLEYYSEDEVPVEMAKFVGLFTENGIFTALRIQPV